MCLVSIYLLICYARSIVDMLRSLEGRADAAHSGSQMPYPNTWKCVLNNSNSVISLRKCMHAIIQSPRF